MILKKLIKSFVQVYDVQKIFAGLYIAYSTSTLSKTEEEKNTISKLNICSTMTTLLYHFCGKQLVSGQNDFLFIHFYKISLFLYR